MPKRDEKNPTGKEVYRLWWEYLKRSDRYRAVWDTLISINMNKKTFPISLSNVKRIRKAYESRPDHLIIATEWEAFFVYFQVFGNVFESEFEDVWQKGHMAKLKDNPLAKLPVVDMSQADAVEKIFAVDTFIKDSDEYLDDYLEPERKTMDIKRLTKESVSYIILGIPIVGTSDMKNISSEIKDIRDRYMKTKKAKVCNWVMKRALSPSGYIRLDELKLYLQVYDLRKQGLTMPQVIEKLRPEQSGDPVNVSRQFFSYQKKAKEIIGNVEMGYFPGEY